MGSEADLYRHCRCFHGLLVSDMLAVAQEIESVHCVVEVYCPKGRGHSDPYRIAVSVLYFAVMIATEAADVVAAVVFVQAEVVSRAELKTMRNSLSHFQTLIVVVDETAEIGDCSTRK
jgi:hypothetical protein